MAESDCSAGWTQKEKRKISSLRLHEKVLDEQESGLRREVRRIEKEFSEVRKRHDEAKERLGYARIERLVHEVIADCRHLTERMKRNGSAALGEVIGFVEYHLGFDNRWEWLHRTLKSHKLPPRAKSMLPLLPETVNAVWNRLLSIASFPETRRANQELVAYLTHWRHANRPEEHWKDDAFKMKVDEAWQRFRDTLGPLVERLRGLDSRGRDTRPKPTPPKGRRRALHLIKRGGVNMPYIIDPANHTIMRKATMRSYRITGDKAVNIVNRLTDGLAKGIKKKGNKANFSVTFTDADARVFRKDRHGDLADFMRNCIVRDPFTGHRSGNRKFADTAHLAVSC